MSQLPFPTENNFAAQGKDVGLRLGGGKAKQPKGGNL
jgi:hypothetical protein